MTMTTMIYAPPNRLYEPYNLELAAYYGLPAAIVDAAIDAELHEAGAQDVGWFTELSPRAWNRIGWLGENRMPFEAEMYNIERERAAHDLPR